MESDLQHHAPLFLDHPQHQQQQMNSGLSRYKSAPSSYFSNIIDRDFYEDLFKRPSSPETERIFARFMNSLGDSDGDGAPADDAEDSLVAQNLPSVQQQQLPAVKEEIDQQSQAMTSMSTEPVVIHQHQQQQQQQQQQQNQSNINSYQNLYQSSGRPPLPTQMKTGRGNASNLIRHGSSPAGLFANINIETGYAAAIRGMGALGARSNTTEEAAFSPSAPLKNPPNYSSGLLSPRAEIGSKSNTPNNPEAEGFAETRGNEFPGFPWDDSAVMSENLSGLKRFRDDDVKPFSGVNAAESQNETGGQAPAPLAHHMSLPNTSAEMAAIEKFLKFSDSVPCKIRAKRGCATHPRSIAERVRRTKISERMRKLQDLVPNMDKQTNTSDMLDLAVDYIKDLQMQVQTLSDCRAKCTCKHKQQ